MAETIKINGVEFISPDACSFGDYGGAGSVGLSNIRAILADERAGEVANTWLGSMEYSDELAEAVAAGAVVIHATGSYGSETVYIRADTELAEETVAALADYPSLDDEGSSSIELEWENEAWESWIRSDLERACWPDDEPAGYAEMADADRFEAYRFAMELTNTYPEAEYSSVYVDIDRIAEAYADAVVRVLAGETVDEMSRKQWPSAYSR